MRRTLFLLLVAALSIAAVSCSSPGVDPGPTLAGPFPSFPYTFSGNFTVDGTPGPAGITIYARMGGTNSPTSAAPADGFYNNIIIGPSSERAEDLRQPVKFYIGTLNGPSVEAEETFEFKVVGAPTSVELNLTFPRLP